MKSLFKTHHRTLFYLSWFLINILQAAFTGLLDDEAYYWIYSLYPSWGYFDHPPMIAMLIKAGTSLFSGELGVRFFIVLMNTLTIFLISLLLEKKDEGLFYAIAGSLAVAQIGGIIAVPDLPLLFFAALFFILYRRFIREMNILNSILLGIGIALMLYSKYHGILLVLFTLASNPSLFRKYHTYITTITALVAFAPHIAWQIHHDLPSVQYHLFERNASAYDVGFTIEYILGQVALAGPIAGWLLLWAASKKRPLSFTEKALKYNFAGIYIFFLVSTFKGRVEANWTIPAFVALMVLSHQYLTDRPSTRRLLLKLLPVTLGLVLVLRIFMALPIERVSWLSKDEFHDNRSWTNEILKRSTGREVVMLNSYQLPSKYWFYTGERAMGLNTPYYRRNNFNFWPVEDSLFGKKAFVLGRKDSAAFNIGFDHPYLHESGAAAVDHYFSFSKIQLKDIEFEILEKTVIELRFTAETPRSYLELVGQQPYDSSGIYIAAIEPGKQVTYYPSGLTVRDIRNRRQEFVFQAPVRWPAEGVIIKLAIASCIPGHPSLNSTGKKFILQ